MRFRPDVPGMTQSISSSRPENRRIFGAVGHSGKAVLPGNGIFMAEAAVTDRGSPAAVAVASFSPATGLDLEPSVRYYHSSWDNPWTGSISDSSTFRGNRARNELGGRLDIAWKSSKRTLNRFRLDISRHGKTTAPARKRPSISNRPPPSRYTHRNTSGPDSKSDTGTMILRHRDATCHGNLIIRYPRAICPAGAAWTGPYR